MAVLCGADGWVGVETYGKAKQEWLKTFLDLPKGIPSHDTFGRVFAQLAPEILEKNFQAWIKLMAGKLGLEVVAVDGKSLNSSYDREDSLKSLQMVSAWSSNHGLVLGQWPVDQKSNEIKAIPILLEQLDLKGAIITIDAMGTQTAIAQQINSAGADYILTLKSNHPTFAHYAKNWFQEHKDQIEDSPVLVTKVICEAGHHRIEKRQFWQVPVKEVFPEERIEQWAGLQTLVIEESSRSLWNKNTSALRFFISSLEPEFSRFPDSIRSHWGVENQLHWCLDVIFAEDDSRIRKDHAPRNMTILRRLALNFLRQETSKDSIKMKRYKAGLDNNFLLKILAESGLF
jgi:predicted transposase YbfD/YdcC